MSPRLKPAAGTGILIATILGSSMAFIDGTVINVALPALQKSLGATVVDVQWVVESYTLFLSALLLVGGSLGDQFGRKLVYVIGISLFTLASIWCGLAPDITQLIVARCVQGIGAALLVPGSLAIISASFPEEKRGKAIGTWSGFTAITTAIGPVLGGWMIENVSWRAIFFINVPMAVVTLVLIFMYVPESRNATQSRKIDWWGAILATGGLGALTYGFIESSQLGFSHPGVIAALAGGALALILFVIVEKKSKHPMMPLELFRSMNFSGANLLTLFLYSALAIAFFFLPMNLIQVQGYSATAAGAANLPFIIILFALSRWAGGLLNTYGSKLPLVVGPTIVAIGYFMFTLPDVGGSYWTTFFPAMVVMGFGMTIAVAPLTTTVMNSVHSERSGVASGINNAVSRVGGLLAIAIVGILMLDVFNARLDEELDARGIPEETQRLLENERINLGAIEIPKTVDSTQAAAINTSIDVAFVSGYRLLMLIAAGLSVLSAISAWLMIEGKKKPRT